MNIYLAMLMMAAFWSGADTKNDEKRMAMELTKKIPVAKITGRQQCTPYKEGCNLIMLRDKKGATYGIQIHTSHRDFSNIQQLAATPTCNIQFSEDRRDDKDQPYQVSSYLIFSCRNSP